MERESDKKHLPKKGPTPVAKCQHRERNNCTLAAEKQTVQRPAQVTEADKIRASTEYIHTLGPFLGVNVGTYSSTMEHLGSTTHRILGI